MIRNITRARYSIPYPDPAISDVQASPRRDRADPETGGICDGHIPRDRRRPRRQITRRKTSGHLGGRQSRMSRHPHTVIERHVR